MHALTEEEGALAVRVARRVLENHIGNLQGDCPALPPVFRDKRGVFVTLTRDGELRGCIGYPYPTHSLEEALCDAAISAAARDPRFPPVRAPELPLLRIEITVLSPPRPLTGEPEARPSGVEVGKHGLIVQGYGRSGLLLPQVPVEWGWDSREFLDHTCLKAGLPAGCWKRKDVLVFTFEGQIFGEG
ncbi:MAG: TIGR00296 family protein [Methanomicrobiales archaeon]|nr:TIGR00296 family protein [Methanomicrobiales archaeon]NYT20761.1 TIGR00296 family protein [Methanomicrobiales archaeon]